MKEVYATSGELEGTDTIIDTLDKELDEIIGSVDSVIETAEKNVQQRLANGEDKSVFLPCQKVMINLQCCPFHLCILSESSKKQRKPLNGCWKWRKNKKIKRRH